MSQINLNIASLKQIINAEQKKGLTSISVGEMEDGDTFAFWPTKQACSTLTKINSHSLYMDHKVLAWCTRLTTLTLYQIETEESELVLAPPTLQTLHLTFMSLNVYVIRLTRDMESLSLRSEDFLMRNRAFNVDDCEQPQIRIDYLACGQELPRIIDTRRRYRMTFEVQGDLVTLFLFLSCSLSANGNKLASLKRFLCVQIRFLSGYFAHE